LKEFDEEKEVKATRLTLIILSCLLFLHTGCSLFKEGVPQWSGSGFIRPEFLEYRRVAILPFEGDPKGESSEAFTLSFRERFQEMMVVDRKRILERFKEQDLHPNRIDEVTRAAIGKAFDVQAVIVGSVYYPSIVRWLLQVRIIDVKMGKSMGGALVEVDFAGAMGLKEGCRLAVQELKPR
jgi:hypothetical protein